MTTEKQPRQSSGLLFFILSLTAAITAFKAIATPPFIFPAVGLALIACIHRAFVNGIINEALAIIRLLAAFGLGWLFSESVGQALGIPGFLAAIVGFYAVFFVSFIIVGKLIIIFKSDERPSIAEKLLGGFVGGFEGILVVWLMIMMIHTIPGSKLATFYPQLFAQLTKPVENILAPVLPDQANNMVQMMKTAQRISHNFKPEKVDRQALQEVLRPLAEMPEIAALQNDESLRELIEKKDFKALLSHPSLRHLLESKSIQEKLKNMDWQKLEQAISPRP